MKRVFDWLEEYPLVVVFVCLAVMFPYVWESLNSFVATDRGFGKQVYEIGNTIFQIITASYFTVIVSINQGRRGAFFLVFLTVFSAAGFLFSFTNASQLSLLSLLSLSYLFGAAVFALLSWCIVNGLGRYLLEKRGSSWVKEIEYFYLALGALSIISGMNRLPQLSTHMGWIDIASPLVLTFAVALRCVKTRAEIAGWNTKEFYERQAAAG